MIVCAFGSTSRGGLVHTAIFTCIVNWFSSTHWSPVVHPKTASKISTKTRAKRAWTRSRCRNGARTLSLATETSRRKKHALQRGSYRRYWDGECCWQLLAAGVCLPYYQFLSQYEISATSSCHKLDQKLWIQFTELRSSQWEHAKHAGWTCWMNISNELAERTCRMKMLNGQCSLNMLSKHLDGETANWNFSISTLESVDQKAISRHGTSGHSVRSVLIRRWFAADRTSQSINWVNKILCAFAEVNDKQRNWW